MWNQFRFYFIIICAAAEVSNTVLGKNEDSLDSSTTSEQLNEIIDLKKELHILDKLENVEKSKEGKKIEGSAKQLADTAHLRNQINEAIKQKSYVHALHAKEKATKPKLSLDLLNLFSGEKEKTVGSNNPNSEEDEIVGAAKTKNSSSHLRKYIEDTLAKAMLSTPLVDNEPDQTVPNNATNANEIPLDFYRETLQVISIVEDSSFSLGEKILEWKTLQMHISNGHALIGRTTTDLILVIEVNGTYRLEHELNFPLPISAFLVFTKWNGISEEGIIAVASEHQITFIRVTDALSQMEIIWKWNMYSTPKTMIYFQLNSKDTLLIINDLNDGGVSADIYIFDLDKRQSWLLQKIPLHSACSSVSFLDVHREYILCFAQNNTAELYHQYHAEVDGFKHLQTLYAPRIQTLTTFTIGGISYLTLGGKMPEILRYTSGKFEAQTILPKAWGAVEYMIPIPARTYRDDLILLIQHRVQFGGGHSIPTLSALVWTGEAFDSTALAVPCYFQGVKYEEGISCMIDLHRDDGIFGSSIIQRGNNISLLVPREEAASGLFQLKFKLIKVGGSMVTAEPPRDALRETIQELLNYQNGIIAEAMEAVDNSIEFGGEASEEWKINSMEVNELFIEDGFSAKEIWFGDELWTEEDSEIDIKALLGRLTDYQKQLDDIERSIEADRVGASVIKHVESPPANGQFSTDSIRIIRDKRSTIESVSKLNVKHLYVEFINDVPVESLVFLDNDGTLNLADTDLYMESELKVLDKVQLPSNDYEVTASETINSLYVTGNMNADTINGVVWTDFVSQLVLTNMTNSFDHLYVQGDIIASDEISISKVNNFQFPDDFLWNSLTSETAIIKGKKTFLGDLTVSDIDCIGLIDNTSTSDVITLQNREKILGLTTFRQLEVTEKLKVNGKISGRHLDDFLANPNLQQTKLIESDCLFHNLEVDGPIYVKKNLGDIDIDAVLGDVIYKNNPKTLVTAFKTFDTFDAEQVNLTSNLINGFHVQDYLTLDTPQTLYLDHLRGNVIFQNLNITGLFDGHNATELDENTIKLFGDQFTEADLTFENSELKDFDLQAEIFDITDSINSVPLTNFVSVNEYLEFNGNVNLNGAIVDDLVHSNGEFLCNDYVNGYSLNTLAANHLSITRSQDITGAFVIKKGIIKGDLEALSINGYPARTLLTQFEKIRNIAAFVSDGKTSRAIETITVDGKADISKLNGHDLEAIKQNAIWLNIPNSIPGNLRFLEPIVIQGNMKVDQINGVNFNEFITGIVRKGELEQELEFNDSKIFTKEIHVSERIDSFLLGAVRTDSILTKTATNLIFSGDLNILGNLHVRNLQIFGDFNGIPFSDISSSYTFDETKQFHVIKMPAVFNGPISIDNMLVHGPLNGIADINKHLQNVVRRDYSGQIFVPKTFNSKVNFNGDLQINNFHKIDLNAFLQQVVLNEANGQALILGNIAFEEHVQAARIHVQNDILTKNIMQCSLLDWMENTIRIDRPAQFSDILMFRPGTFQAASIQVERLNGIRMDEVITKHTPQNLSGTLYFSKLYAHSQIGVKGLVNGLNLWAERDNTVMVTGDQYITAPTRLSSARVLNNLHTTDTVNGIMFRYPVLLNGELPIQSPISFRSVSFDNLYTNEEVSGIHFNQWYENTLKKRSNLAQVVTGTWNLDQLILDGNIEGTGILNGLKINEVAERLLSHKENIESNLQVFKHSYKDVCIKVNDIVRSSQHFQYSLTGFEDSFRIDSEDGKINSFHFFASNNDKFLLNNAGCFSTVYVWNPLHGIFQKVTRIESGTVQYLVHTFDDILQLHLITNSYPELSQNCAVSGLNIWKFNGGNLLPVKKLGAIGEYSLMLVSKIKQHLMGRFYALKTLTQTVIDFDIFGNIWDEWNLPTIQPKSDQSSGGQYRFLPEEINLGLALSDGSRLSILTPSTDDVKRRTERTIELMRSIHESIKNATGNLKSADRAAKRIGPLHNISVMPSEPGFFRGLFSHTNGSTRLVETFSNTSPIKLKLFPMETTPVDFSRSYWTSKLYPTSTAPTTLSEKSKKSQMKLEGGVGDDATIPKSDTQNGNIEVAEKAGLKSSARTDAFGMIEDMAKPIADNIMDTIVNIADKVPSDDETDVEAIRNETITNEGDAKNLSSSARTDAFGMIEDMSKPIADNIMDTLVNIMDKVPSNEETDVEAAPNKTLQVTEEADAKNLSSSARTDAFGMIEDMSKPIADNLMDTLVNIMDKVPSDDETDVEAAPNKTLQVTEEADAQNLSSIARTDAFGMIEDMSKPIADNIMDNLVNIMDKVQSDDDTDVEAARNETMTNEDNAKNVSSTAGTDAFGMIEDMSKPIADNIMDTVVNIMDKVPSDDETDVEAAPNKTLQVTEEGDAKNVSSTARTDAFGMIEDMSKPIADNIMDTLVNIMDKVPSNEETDVEAIRNETITNENDAKNVSSTARTDAFGMIEDMSKPIADNIMDTLVNIMDKVPSDDDTDVEAIPIENVDKKVDSPKPYSIDGYNDTSATTIYSPQNHTENVGRPMYDNESLSFNSSVYTGNKFNESTSTVGSLESTTENKVGSSLVEEIEKFAEPIVEDIIDSVFTIHKKPEEENDKDDGVGRSIEHQDASLSLTNSSIYSADKINEKTSTTSSPESTTENKVGSSLVEEIEKFAEPIVEDIIDSVFTIHKKPEEESDDINDESVSSYKEQQEVSSYYSSTHYIDKFNKTASINLTAPTEANYIETATATITSDQNKVVVEEHSNENNETHNKFPTDITLEADNIPQGSDNETVGGIAKVFASAIKDVAVTYLEGRELIKDLREEIHQREEERYRDQHRVHHKQHYRKHGYDDYDDDNLGMQQNGTDPDENSEAKISTEIRSEGGVATTDNTYLPADGTGEEIVSIYVRNIYRKTLIAVSTLSGHVVQGRQDMIRIYEDVIEGRLFQTIMCHHPRSLTVFYLRDETIFAFLERQSEVQIYVYRGIEGFLSLSHFSFDSYVAEMTAITVPRNQAFACPRTYLVLRMEREVRFLEAITNGFCGIDVDLNCE